MLKSNNGYVIVLLAGLLSAGSPVKCFEGMRRNQYKQWVDKDGTPIRDNNKVMGNLYKDAVKRSARVQIWSYTGALVLGITAGCTAALRLKNKSLALPVGVAGIVASSTIAGVALERYCKRRLEHCKWMFLSDSYIDTGCKPKINENNRAEFEREINKLKTFMANNKDANIQVGKNELQTFSPLLRCTMYTASCFNIRGYLPWRFRTPALMV